MNEEMIFLWLWNTTCKILHANLFSICLLVVYSFCILNNNIIPAWSPLRYANQLRLTTWKSFFQIFILSFFSCSPTIFSSSIIKYFSSFCYSLKDCVCTVIRNCNILLFFLLSCQLWSENISCWYVVPQKCCDTGSISYAQ